MPPLTRWYIKSAMLCLAAGLLLGAAQAAPLPLIPHTVLTAAGPAYVHLLVGGWITQMIFGVAYWMFPKHSVDTPRGSDVLAVTTFALLNSGLLLRVLAEPAHTMLLGAWPDALLAVSAAAQWLAGVGFVVNTWPRVKEK
jgi:Trk-type K+ transport system membrane component